LLKIIARDILIPVPPNRHEFLSCALIETECSTLYFGDSDCVKYTPVWNGKMFKSFEIALLYALPETDTTIVSGL
jgi:hypothetical protein